MLKPNDINFSLFSHSTCKFANSVFINLHNGRSFLKMFEKSFKLKLHCILSWAVKHDKNLF